MQPVNGRIFLTLNHTENDLWGIADAKERNYIMVKNMLLELDSIFL